jgi:hypothetical protein
VDLEIHAEMLTSYLKGMRQLLEAWIQYEHVGTLVSDQRDEALTLLGFAAEQLGATLDAKVAALRSVRPHPSRVGA